MILSKLLISQAVKVLSEKFSLDKLKSYVFDENELDRKVDNIEDRLKILEKMAHSPKNFKCKYKDKKEINYG